MKTTKQLAGGKFSIEMWEFGSGDPLLFIHGAGGLFGVDPFLEEFGKTHHVYAPHFPGYGESTGSEQIDDIVDAALFYHELMDELKVPTANLVGHSMGGMMAAEVAALDNSRAKKLVLVAPAGMWLDEYPIPDLFAAKLDEVAPMMFHDPKSPMAQAFGAIPTDFKELEAMYVERVKRFSTASKFLWPIPDRGLKKRAYRIKAPTLVLWGASDKLILPVYAKEFTKRIAGAKEQQIAEAGHMLPYEQQEAFCKAVNAFLKG